MTLWQGTLHYGGGCGITTGGMASDRGIRKKRERDIVGHNPFIEMLTGPRHKAISKAQKVADTVNGARHQPP